MGQMTDPIASNGVAIIQRTGNGVITYNMAWQWVCMAHDVLQLIKQLPDPKIYWKTDTADIMALGWLQDCARPEWGHVFVYANFRNQTHFIGLVKLLENEIKRYNEMKEIVGWRLPYMQEAVKNGSW